MVMHGTYHRRESDNKNTQTSVLIFISYYLGLFTLTTYGLSGGLNEKKILKWKQKIKKWNISNR